MKEVKPIGFKLAELKYGNGWHKKITEGTLSANYSDMKYYCDRGHAVTIVGYDDSGFLIKNSWGKDNFGEGGYGWISFDYHRLFADEALILTAGFVDINEWINKKECRMAERRFLS